MSGRILRALLRKEVTLMRRNPILPKIIFVMPLMVMLVIPLVANLDVKQVNVAVVDNSHSQLSRCMVADMAACGTFNITAVTDNHREAMSMIENGVADVVLTIPARFEHKLAAGDAHVDIESNGVNPTTGLLGGRYVAESVMNTIGEWRKTNGIQGIGGNEIKTPDILYMYNPTLNFRNYMIPALMVVLLIIICGFLPALNLVSEKESGTIEAINVTPVGKLTFVLSKLLPFWAVGLLVVTIGMAVGWIVYGLVPEGNIALIYLASILFTLVMSGLGVTIANKSDTMLQSIFVMFAFIMIFQLMGGLFTPIKSMPDWAQALTYAIPPRYYIEIMRDVYLKGTPFTALLPGFLALTAFAAAFLILAAATYRKQG